ncbi:MAG: DUF4405 domain-containing protein [Selenomonadaceae bacterium]|nr:DUF4405 domain-containing protein [Selenomonadaceae bacterium]
MKRIILDIALFILCLFTISFQFLPRILHEILGLAMLAAAIWHLWLNRAWISSLGKGNWTVLRGLSTLVNMLLIASMVVIIVTGCFISNYLFKGWFGMELQRSILVHQLHVSLSYWLLILIGLHLGFHWQGLWHRLAKWRKWEESSAPYRLATRFMPLMILVVGIYGSFLNRVGDRLLMKHIFATEAVHQPFAVYILLLIGIVGLYGVIGFFLRKWLTGRRSIQ